MSISEFTREQNVTMLWEVISDEDLYKCLLSENKTNVYQLFANNIAGFYNSEKSKIHSLVDINKKYILLILNYIKKSYVQETNKIKIYNEPVKESITYEDLQNDKRNKFERDLGRRQEEFEEYMTPKVPDVPQFADVMNDTPIKEMDRIIKEMEKQRNYEMEEINRNYENQGKVDNWLKPLETSSKMDKFILQSKEDKESKEDYPIHSKLKHLNRLDVEKDKKNVSFSNVENIHTFHEEDDDVYALFSKLKKTNEDTSGFQALFEDGENNDNNKNKDKTKDKDKDKITILENELRDIHLKVNKILELLRVKY